MEPITKHRFVTNITYHLEKGITTGLMAIVMVMLAKVCLNGMSMTELYEIKTLLDDSAKVLTQALTTVGELRGWVVYFFEALEAETQNLGAYEKMMIDLVEDIQLRIDSAGW